MKFPLACNPSRWTISAETNIQKTEASYLVFCCVKRQKKQVTLDTQYARLTNEFQFKFASCIWWMKICIYENKNLKFFWLIYKNNIKLETKHEKNLKFWNFVVILFSQSTKWNVMTQKVSALQTKYWWKNKPKMMNQECSWKNYHFFMIGRPKTDVVKE